MYWVFKKEVARFLGSFSGYLILALFLLLNGLFLWVFPSFGFNILDLGYASMQPFFYLAPWLLLFLIPALTMHLFSEEIKLGTLEILYTRPLSDWQIILGKFLAAFSFACLAILPSLIYFYMLYVLGEIRGNIDVPATFGSYLGLFFLVGAFTAIGVFCSSLTQNQITSFLWALFLCFIAYLGFESLSDISFFSSQAFYVKKLGMYAHYRSISRGVIDTRDLIYFISICFLFLFFTRQIILIKRS